MTKVRRQTASRVDARHERIFVGLECFHLMRLVGVGCKNVVVERIRIPAAEKEVAARHHLSIKHWIGTGVISAEQTIGVLLETEGHYQNEVVWVGARSKVLRIPTSRLQACTKRRRRNERVLGGIAIVKSAEDDDIVIDILDEVVRVIVDLTDGSRDLSIRPRDARRARASDSGTGRRRGGVGARQYPTTGRGSDQASISTTRNSGACKTGEMLWVPVLAHFEECATLLLLCNCHGMGRGELRIQLCKILAQLLLVLVVMPVLLSQGVVDCLLRGGRFLLSVNLCPSEGDLFAEKDHRDGGLI